MVKGIYIQQHRLPLKGLQHVVQRLAGRYGRTYDAGGGATQEVDARGARDDDSWRDHRQGGGC